MKTLYVSDLDGTLLNRNAELSEYSRGVLNRFAASGGLFGVATARTLATVAHIMAGVNLAAPAILMNGAAVYDSMVGKYILTREFSAKSYIKLIDTAEMFGLSCFFYRISGDRLTTFYSRLDTEHAHSFMDERIRKYGKLFVHIDSIRDLAPDNIVYFSVCDSKERLDPVANIISADCGLKVVYHSDVYNPGLWYLDICAAEASKASALRFVREYMGAGGIVAFGDNHNDISLFEAADECYAVENAVPELKRLATAIIDSNNADGVAHWIETNLLRCFL